MGEIWYGGTIYTMREENEKVDAVYVENGTIVDFGSKEELENQYAAVTLHDLKGKTMIPGLVDSYWAWREITPSRFIKLYILW